MPEITPNTSFKISIVAFVAMVLWMGGASWKVFGYTNQIEQNTVAIQAVVQSLELSRIDREIGGLQAEQRDLERAVKQTIDNQPLKDLLQDQISDIEDEIDLKFKVRECIVEPNQKVCQ